MLLMMSTGRDSEGERGHDSLAVTVAQCRSRLQSEGGTHAHGLSSGGTSPVCITTIPSALPSSRPAVRQKRLWLLPHGVEPILPCVGAEVEEMYAPCLASLSIWFAQV
jgi:hypothetical protein